MKRPVNELRVKLSNLLDKMEKAEERGCSRDEIVILGAFADGLAFALGEKLDEDYFELANKLAGIQPESDTKSLKNWKSV